MAAPRRHLARNNRVLTQIVQRFHELGDIIDDDLVVVENYDEMRALGLVDGRFVFCRGRATAGDDGWGFFDCTTDSLAAAITADPTYGFFVKHATQASSAGGFKRRANLYEARPGFFGSVGNGSTDDFAAVDAAKDFAGATISNVKNRGGAVIIEKRHALSETLVLDTGNVTLRGLGYERIASAASSLGAALLIGTGLTGPIVRIRSSDVRLIGFEIRSSATRLADGVIDTGEDLLANCYIGPTDGGSEISGIRLEDMFFRDAPEDAIHAAGPVTRLDLIRTATNLTGRHSFFQDDGTLAARLTKSRPGQIYVRRHFAVDSQGYGFCTGNPSEGAAGAPYRVEAFGLEVYRCAIDSAQTFADLRASVYLGGENISAEECGFGGTTTGNADSHPGVAISAASARLIENRYIGCVGSYVIIGDNPNYTDRIITIDGGVAVSDTAAALFAAVDPDARQVTIKNIRNPAGLGYTALTDRDTLTIASGVANIILPRHYLSAESGTADDLTTLNGGVPGQRALLMATSGHTITVKDGSVNITCGSDRVLTGQSLMELECNDAGTGWRCISYQDNT